MNQRTLATLLRYGVSNLLAEKANEVGLTISKVRTLSQRDMVSKYGLTTGEAKALTAAVRRAAIDSGVVQLLLERSNFVCCVCKGMKGHAYIIHHIVEYEKTQDNSYDNLAVLCPNDHDLAHQRGLSLRLTVNQIRNAKTSWEQKVLVANVRRAAQMIEVNDDAIDYVNVNRIEELCVRLFKEIPTTGLTDRLKRARILKKDGSFDQRFVQTKLSGGRYLFDYITHQETEHYKQLMQEIATVTEFIDLDAAASAGRTKLKATEGQYAFFIGGVCAKGPDLPIVAATPPIMMHYSRKNIRIEWILDPMFLMSTSAIARIGGKNRYVIYCLIRTVDKQEGGDILVKASPLLIAQPTTYIDKTPLIAYQKRHERDIAEGFDDEDEGVFGNDFNEEESEW
ncbi:HNH endonuclease signature motif containing protein [Duganella sp. HH101]|uniref:HNH endonuclease signature motif containing protein n=1 Tax=Duganella sp. HH101 TaxID=1781066 RepID=UPI0009F4B6EC|nr:HNH endonuclease signature motif containing protein [Duganella sp. HH101]